MFIVFNYYSICLLIGGFIAFISGIVVFLNDRKKAENQLWFAMTASTSIWSFAYFYMTIAPDKDSGWLANWILHDAAIFIPLFYFLLVLVITETFKRYRVLVGLFSLCSIFFMTINSSTIFVADVVPKVGFNYAPVPGPFYIYYFIFFSLLVFLGCVISAFAAYKTSDPTKRKRFMYTIYFAVAAAIGGGSVFATTYFPWIKPYPLILFSIYPAIAGYAILKHQLFNVRLITTQVITFGLWLAILLRMFFAESAREQFANAILFVFVIVLGVFLIRSVRKEVEQREKIEKLAHDLEDANTHLTELDQQKSEFVSLASHQLRGPLTAIKGYASMLRDGDFGEINPDAKDAVDKIFKSTGDLGVVVEDYLNVSRIEQGRMQYDFTTFDVRELVATLITELKPNFERAKLAVDFDFDPTSSYKINADQGKIKQVIGNIIDNSIKYTPKGSIHIWLSRKPANSAIGMSSSNASANTASDEKGFAASMTPPANTAITASTSVSDAHTTAGVTSQPSVMNARDISTAGNKDKVLITISDTGVGIHPDVLPRLFEKFTRAPDASKTNIMGTGLGLYVAKKMIEAHHGRIWADSAGVGKGSSFFIELDAMA